MSSVTKKHTPRRIAILFISVLEISFPKIKNRRVTLVVARPRIKPRWQLAHTRNINGIKYKVRKFLFISYFCNKNRVNINSKWLTMLGRTFHSQHPTTGTISRVIQRASGEIIPTSRSSLKYNRNVEAIISAQIQTTP